MERNASGHVDPGMRHVVSVADERHLEVVERSPVLENGQHVSQNLAGVKPIRKTVDDGNTCEPCHFFEQIVPEHPGHDAV
jgi:hypothetical protein